ncbi:MAG: hydroxyacid dehydrogenase, partial [Candidatus Marsarchaeota archaeon]|nr:hydroxyacid dehydrogenase [Candidatus Marsarchaeota archaeon]
MGITTVAFFELEEWEKKYLKRKLRGCELKFIDGHLSAQNVRQAADAEIASVFIYSRIGQSELASLPKLKLVATRSTGVDHIDVGACAARGVAV